MRIIERIHNGIPYVIQLYELNDRCYVRFECGEIIIAGDSSTESPWLGLDKFIETVEKEGLKALDEKKSKSPTV